MINKNVIHTLEHVLTLLHVIHHGLNFAWVLNLVNLCSGLSDYHTVQVLETQIKFFKYQNHRTKLLQLLLLNDYYKGNP